MPLAQISERRLAANRANSRKSTGPRTPEGKRQSSQNACQHHLYGRKFTMSPEAAAANEARARRDSAGVEDPALRELYYRLILATGHCELNWSLRDGLEAHARSLFPGDPQLADWWMLHQSGFLAALHRHECFHSRQTLEILKTIEKLQRAQLKNRPRSQTTQDRTHAAPQPQTQSNAPHPDYGTTRLPFNGVHNLKVQTPWLPDPEAEFEPIYPVPANPPAPLTFAAPRNTSERTHSHPEPESQPSLAVPNPRPFSSATKQNTSERTHSQPEPKSQPKSQPTPAVPTTQPFPSAAKQTTSERTHSRRPALTTFASPFRTHFLATTAKHQNLSERTHRTLPSRPPTPAWAALADLHTQISLTPHAKPPPSQHHHAPCLAGLQAGARATALTWTIRC